MSLRPRSGARRPQAAPQRRAPGTLLWSSISPRITPIAAVALVAAGLIALAALVQLQAQRGRSGAQLGSAAPQQASQIVTGVVATAGASTAPTAAPSPPVTGTPAGQVIAGAAPTSATGFSLRHTIVSVRFPLKSAARYSYSDNFLVPRVGTPYSYNHALPTSGGGLRRAHDGVDIYVAIGTPVLSPFDGVVIDPATRWKPWIPSRYGITAVIASAEPGSRGYVAILAHLSVTMVRPGDRVQRGQVLGRTGRTGNAEATRPHLHFELRAPFLLRVRAGTRVRRVDAFDPYPSLVAADPRRKTVPTAP